jgi:large subunit ribosomal protein L4
MSLPVINQSGKPQSNVEIPAALKKEVINKHLIYEVVKAELANRRQGTHKTKERGEVRGGGRKPFRQKGTGRARQGSIRAPQWKGGGVIFGPRPKSYRVELPAKKKQAGAREIIANKIKEERFALISELKFEGVSTKAAYLSLDNIVKASPFFENYSKDRKLQKAGSRGRRMVTIVLHQQDEITKKSLRNIPWIQTLHVDRLSAVGLFQNHGLYFTKEAFEAFTARLG